MTYHHSKNKMYTTFFMGLIICLTASISTIISMLKMFYYGVDGTDPLSNILATHIQKLVNLIYIKTASLDFFWVHAPLPTFKELWTTQNLYFFTIYIFILIGIKGMSSARTLQIRIRKIDRYAEDQKIINSMSGNKISIKKEVNQNIYPQESKRFSQFHALYLAPVIVGLIVAIIAKVAGLT